MPRVSATPVELSDAYRETFLPERHSSLQANRTVLQDVRERLIQMQAPHLAAVRSPAVRADGERQPALAVEVDDLYAPGEPVRLKARTVHTDAVEGVQTRLEPVGVPDPAAVTAAFEQQSDGHWELTVELEAGSWRVAVSSVQAGPDAPPAVHDIFEVAG